MYSWYFNAGTLRVEIGMDGKKILEVIAIYRKHLAEDHITYPIDYVHNEKVTHRADILSHCHGMLDKMEEFVRQGRMEKAFRWLGFIQGCLWSAGCYTLEELKNHSRPN